MKALFVLLALALSGCAATAPSDLDRLLTADTTLSHLAPPPLDYARLERAVLAEVNAVRAQHGRGALAYIPNLEHSARAHSEHMSAEAFFSHEAMGKDAGRRAGLGERSIGENLYLAHRFRSYERLETGGGVTYSVDWRSEEEIARHAVALWMQSPSHRANLLSTAYGGQAVGVATGSGATVFITQSLAPRSRF
jgi:uncharacterized protein YkwD